MIKIVIVILLALPLTSFARPPAVQPAVYRVRLALLSVAPAQQECTWETALSRLRQQISDSAGIPFGQVDAWSCSGDAQAVMAELSERASAMQAEANAYRAAHPLATPRPSR